jgi:hypothetical protein
MSVFWLFGNYYNVFFIAFIRLIENNCLLPIQRTPEYKQIEINNFISIIYGTFRQRMTCCSFSVLQLTLVYECNKVRLLTESNNSSTV